MSLRPVRAASGLLAAWVATLLLAACATPPPALQLTASGRLAVQVAASATESSKGFNASFELWGQADQGELQLRTSLGTWLVTARWAPGRADLITPQGESAFASLAELSQQALGEALPLDALPDWLAGRPRPGRAQQACRPAAAGCFEQEGWQVDHSRRDAGLVVASRSQPPQVTVRLRLDSPV